MRDFSINLFVDWDNEGSMKSSFYVDEKYRIDIFDSKSKKNEILK